MNNTTIKSALIIAGDYFDIEEVTKTLNIIPTEKCVKGHVIRLTNSGKEVIAKDTYWIYSLEEEELYLSIQLNKLYDIFYDKIDKIKALKDKYDLIIKFDVVINIENNRTPGIYIDKHIVDFASKLEAVFDIDMYVY